MPSQRTCKDCKTEGRAGKPLNIYCIDGEPVPGPRCFRHYHAWRKAQAESRAHRDRARIYNMPQDVYDALLAFQNGVCYICLRPPLSKRLQIDHDHRCCPGDTSCGKCIRGLICGKDNRHIAWLGDDPVLAHRMYEYLTNPPAHRLASVTKGQVG